MFGPRTIIRPLLASAFIASGINSLRSPQAGIAAAQEVGMPMAEVVGVSTNPLQLVKINGYVQVGAGALLALGFFPRAASLALATSVVPTTLGNHRFWEQTDPAAKQAQLTQFLKGASILGGLLTSALDTGGRPSVFWSSRRAASRAADSIATAAQHAADQLPKSLRVG